MPEKPGRILGLQNSGSRFLKSLGDGLASLQSGKQKLSFWPVRSWATSDRRDGGQPPDSVMMESVCPLVPWPDCSVTDRQSETKCRLTNGKIGSCNDIDSYSPAPITSKPL